MHIICNGEQKTIDRHTSLHDLVLSLQLEPQTLVAEVNGTIIEHPDFTGLTLRENDRVELIRFVGGG